VKRSQALRGRNLTRNSRIDGAPKRTSPRAASWGLLCSGKLASDTGAMPPKIPVAQPPSSAERKLTLAERGNTKKMVTVAAP
jgi:hypothetical protein